MSNNDLSKLGAFDLFLSNTDRHSDNLFKLKNKNKIYGMDNGFSVLNPVGFTEFKIALVKNYDKLTENQKQNLKTFKQTLETLLYQNHYKESQKRFSEYIKLSLNRNEKSIGLRLLEKRSHAIIKDNYYECLDLVRLLNDMESPNRR